ncbi:MAG: MBL fold metallo-hydrolase [Acidobacteriota bacterium]|nr:MBL fold metallo-hydrolase [Acidobacteriota bacterium]
MKVTIIYDNTAYKKGLQPDWGFSALIEVENTPKILFDTGANGKILLNNMEKLEIDPASIDELFISHSHFDHTGGLSEFLNVNQKAKVYIPTSFRGVKNIEVVKVSKAIKIHENVFSTGELDGIEQSMAIKTEKALPDGRQGIVIIAGCSHPYMGHILDAARRFGEIYGIIGGLHGFNEFELFKDLKLICATHCTKHKAELKKLYPKEYIEGGAGRIIEI